MTVGFIGSVSDDGLIGTWKEIYESHDWVPGMPELIDLNAFKDTKVTDQGLRKLLVRMVSESQELTGGNYLAGSEGIIAPNNYLTKS